MEIAQINRQTGCAIPAAGLASRGKAPANAWPLISLVSGGMAVVWIGTWEGSLVGTLVVTVLLLGLGAGILFLEGRFSRSGNELIYQFLLTFGFRIFVAALLHAWLASVSPLPLWNIGIDGGDERDFYETSEHWLSAWSDGRILAEPMMSIEEHYAVWTYCVGFIRFVGMCCGGDTLFNVKLLACFFGSLLVPYIFLLGRYFFDDKIARRAAWLAFLLPDYWYMSASLMRDVMNSCIVVMTVYQAVAGCRGGLKSSGRWILLLFLNFIVLRYLKIWLSEVLFVCFLLWWFKGKSKSNVSRFFIAMWAVGLLVIPFLVIRSAQSPSAFVASLGTIGIDNIDLNERITLMSVSAMDEASSSSIGKAIIGLGSFVSSPILVGQMLLSIPPWLALRDGMTPRGLIESLATWIWLGFVIFLPAGFLECFRQEKTRSSIWIWGTAVTLMWLLAVSGTIVLRWRLMVMPLLLILVAVGTFSRTFRWTVRWSIAAVLGLLAVYVIVKGSY